MSDTIDAMQAPPAIRAAAIERGRAALERWGIAPPPVEPLVLDFGLGDFEAVGLVEYWLANEPTFGYCGKYLFCAAGQRCPVHHHRTKHETFHVMAGRFAVTLDERCVTMRPGDVLPIAPPQPHGFRADGGPALLLELSMPCDVRDNHFQDPRVDRWLQQSTQRDSVAD